MCAHAQVWEAEDDVRYLTLSSCALLPCDSVSLNLIVNILLGWMARELLRSTYLRPWNAGLQAHEAMPGFYMIAEDLNSRPCFSADSALTYRATSSAKVMF